MRNVTSLVLCVVANIVGVACTRGSTGTNNQTMVADVGDEGASKASVLVFSRTLGYRHDSIPDGIAAIQALALDHDWDVEATEDPTFFDDAKLNGVTVVVFLSTTGDVLDADQQAAFERFVNRGGGFVGIHSASDTEYDWPFYGGLVGTYFREHPDIQEAVIHVEDAEHPAAAMLPTEWRRTDEWYAFIDNPRPRVTVLLTLDESTYSPGTATMGADHPISWFHSYEGGRAFYTAVGHTRESYTEPAFLAHIGGGIDWAAGR